jgi:hypothetical protein
VVAEVGPQDDGPAQHAERTVLRQVGRLEVRTSLPPVSTAAQAGSLQVLRPAQPEPLSDSPHRGPPPARAPPTTVSRGTLY